MKSTHISKFRRILVAGIFLGGLFPSLVFAQDITGAWHGQLALPMGKLAVVLHIDRTEGGGYVSTLDSPDQGAVGIQTARTDFKDSLLTIDIPALQASYKGTLIADRVFKGTFTQGMSFSLDLRQGEMYRRPQEPRPPFPYRSEEVSVRNEADKLTLAGTLTLPKEGSKFPAVVLVTGSGGQNRDEEIKGHKPFLVIADYLTRHGIAVLRCDDRGIGGSQGNFAAATDEDFVYDAEAAVRYLRGRKEIDARRIGLIGHSSGGTVALRVAAGDPEVAFVVSMAGGGVRGDSLMARQVELLNRSMGVPEEETRRRVESSRRQYAVLLQTDKSAEELREELYANAKKELSPVQLLNPAVARQVEAQVAAMTTDWYLHFMRYEPGRDLRKVKCPVLAVNGGRDVQVDVRMNLNAIRWHVTSGGNENVTTKEYPGLNHLFQTCRKGTVQEYGEIEETIAPQVLEDVTGWILGNI